MLLMALFSSYIAKPERLAFHKDPIKWWTDNTDYPNLSRMALHLLAIPATSTPSERTFSRAGDIFTSHRKCVIGETAQALLNVGSWWSIQGLPGPNHPIIRHPKIDARYIHVRMPLVKFTTKWGTLTDGGQQFEVEETLDMAGGDEEVVEEELELISIDEEGNEEGNEVVVEAYEEQEFDMVEVDEEVALDMVEVGIGGDGALEEENPL